MTAVGENSQTSRAEHRRPGLPAQVGVQEGALSVTRQEPKDSHPARDLSKDWLKCSEESVCPRNVNTGSRTAQDGLCHIAVTISALGDLEPQRDGTHGWHSEPRTTEQPLPS